MSYGHLPEDRHAVMLPVRSNSVAASVLLLGGLEQETSSFSLLLAARVCAGVSVFDKNTEP